jgi:hypothetical protein
MAERNTRALLGVMGLFGALACEPQPVEPPSAPRLAAVESPTRAELVTISGAKPAGTGIREGDDEVVALDADNTFQVDVALLEGSNTLSFVAFDGAGRTSEAVEVTIEVDRTPPAAPTVDAFDSPTTAASITLTGTKEEGSRLFVSGAEQATFEADTTWSYDVALAQGDNQVRLTAADALGNESDPLDVTILRGAVTFTVDASPTVTRADTVTFRGTRGAGVAVLIDDVTVVAGGASGTTWGVTRVLAEGANTFVLKGVLGTIEQEVTRTVTRDTTAPAAPSVDAVQPTGVGCQASVSGSKEADTGVRVDGVDVVPVDALTTFGPLLVPVPPGDGTLRVLAFDAVGNRSGEVSPAPVTYCDPNGVYFAVDPWPRTVAASPLTLTGVRGGNVAVEIDGNEVVAANGSTTWSYDLALVADTDDSFEVAGVAGGLRNTVTVDVRFAATPPAAPTATAPALVTASPVTITGTRPADTEVLVGDTAPYYVVVPTGAATDWTWDMPLQDGANSFRFRTRDAFGRVSAPVTLDVTYDQFGPTGTITSPQVDQLVGRSVQVNGTANDDDGITEVRVCVGACTVAGDFVTATGTTSWAATIDTLAFGGGTNAATNTVEVRVDTPLQSDVTVATRAVYLLNAPVDVATTTGPSFPAVVPLGADHALAAAYDDGGAVTLLINNGPEWSPASQQLAAAGASLPRVAHANDAVSHVVFLDEAQGLAGAPGVSHRTWNGSVLGGPFAVVAGAAGRGVLSTDVAADASVAAVFVRGDGSGNADVERSTLSGTTWGAPVLVTDATSDQPRAARAALTTDGNLHVVWVDQGDYDGDGSPDNDILYARADPTGAAAPSERFVVSSEVSYGGTLTDGGYVADGGVLLDGGFAGDFLDGDSRMPVVVADPGRADRVWVAWIDSGTFGGQIGGTDAVFLVSITAGALDIGSLQVVTADIATGSPTGLAMTSTGAAGEMMIAWTAPGDVLGSGADVDLYARTYQGGSGGAVSLVSSSADTARYPALAVDPQARPMLLWQDDDGSGGALRYFLEATP